MRERTRRPAATPPGDSTKGHRMVTHTDGHRPAPRPRHRRLGSPRAGDPGGAGDRVAAAADRPARLGEDADPDAPGRGARAGASPLQRVPPELRRPGRLPGAGERPTGLSADTRHDLGRGVGAVRRDLPLPAGTAEQAVPDRPRAGGPGHQAEQAAPSMGRDEPGAVGGRIRQHARVRRRRTSGHRAGRSLRLHRVGAVARGPVTLRISCWCSAASNRPRMPRHDCGHCWRTIRQAIPAAQREASGSRRRVRADRRPEAGAGRPSGLDPPRRADHAKHRRG